MTISPKVDRVVRHTLAGVAILLFPASCGPGYQAPPVNAQLVKIAGIPVSQLERGHLIHQAKCAKCHPFEDPAQYSADDLTFDIMPTMARKSKIDVADEQAVLEYLLAARKMPRADAAAPTGN